MWEYLCSDPWDGDKLCWLVTWCSAMDCEGRQAGRMCYAQAKSVPPRDYSSIDQKRLTEEWPKACVGLRWVTMNGSYIRCSRN